MPSLPVRPGPLAVLAALASSMALLVGTRWIVSSFGHPSTTLSIILEALGAGLPQLLLLIFAISGRRGEASLQASPGSSTEKAEPEHPASPSPPAPDLQRPQAGGVPEDADRRASLDAALSSALLFRPVAEELASSISRNLSSTTTPISEELLRIRRTIAAFLAGIREYEDEVRNRSTLIALEKESEAFSSELQGLGNAVGTSFGGLEGKFEQLKTVASRIARVASDIEEVASKIRILSINASIEAARAGETGRGFRVIAAEVKTLSADTELHLGEINETLGRSREIFADIGESLGQSRSFLSSIVERRQGGFGALSAVLKKYFDQFEALYHGVGQVIASLSTSMDAISPVVQLHEITSQEIGNLGLVASDFSVAISSDLSKAGGSGRASGEWAADVDSLGKLVRSRLTTERELLALKRGLEAGPGSAVDYDPGVNSRDIELF